MTTERKELLDNLHDEFKKAQGTGLVIASFEDEKKEGEKEICIIGAGSVPDLARLIGSAAKQNEHLKMALLFATIELL